MGSASDNSIIIPYNNGSDATCLVIQTYSLIYDKVRVSHISIQLGLLGNAQHCGPNTHAERGTVTYI